MMVKWIQTNPMCVLLVPLLAVILCLHYTGQTLWDERENGLDITDTAYHTYPLVVSAMPSECPKTWRYETLCQGEKIVLYLQKDSTRAMPIYGDTLLVQMRLDKPYIPSRHWVLSRPNRTPWWQSACGWQYRLRERYMELGLSGQELETYSALTLGYRVGLDKEVKRSFSAAGAMHVLAVSGLHTGILMMALMSLITVFGLCQPLYVESKKRTIQGCLVMLLLIGYAFITGCSPSVVRSVLMACLYLLAVMTNRYGQALNVIFASAFLTLALTPSDLFSISFQLSYAAVVAIALFYPGWNNLIPKSRIATRWYGKGVYYVYSLVGVSLAAQIGTMPFTLYYFGQISNYFLLTNMIVIPLAWLMMVGGVGLWTVGWWTPLGKGLAWLMQGVTWCLNQSVSWIEHLPGATTQVVLPTYGMVILMVIACAFLVIWKHVTTQYLVWKKLGNDEQ